VAGSTDRSEAVAGIDDALRRLRRFLTKPPGEGVVVCGLQMPYEVAQIDACEAIAELGADQPVVTVKDVAADLALDHSSASRLLARAEANGLVQRTADPDDRRRTCLSLTGPGRDAVAVAGRVRMRVLGGIVQEWSDAELALFTELFARLSTEAESRVRSLAAGELTEDVRIAIEETLREAGARVQEHL
jgi:DNA-binding MarR family transcriptional regulator